MTAFEAVSFATVCLVAKLNFFFLFEKRYTDVSISFFCRFKCFGPVKFEMAKMAKKFRNGKFHDVLFRCET
jgi:hypothetical protein